MLFDQNYSELEGYWEEGYHYYIEIRRDHITIRDYAKKIISETSFQIKTKGQRKVLKLKKCDMAYGNEKPYGKIEDLYLENGVLYLTYFYTYKPEEKEHKELKKVENGPFSNIIIHDDEMDAKLSGKWIAEDKSEVYIKYGKLKMTSAGGYTEIDEKVHFIEYKTSQGRFYLVPEDLTKSSFDGYSYFTYEADGKLITTPIIFDLAHVKDRVFYKEN